MATKCDKISLVCLEITSLGLALYLPSLTMTAGILPMKISILGVFWWDLISPKNAQNCSLKFFTVLKWYQNWLQIRLTWHLGYKIWQNQFGMFWNHKSGLSPVFALYYNDSRHFAYEISPKNAQNCSLKFFTVLKWYQNWLQIRLTWHLGYKIWQNQFGMFWNHKSGLSPVFALSYNDSRHSAYEISQKNAQYGSLIIFTVLKWHQNWRQIPVKWHIGYKI